MQRLADICIRRPVFATMLIMALVVVGGASYTRLNVDRFPSVDLPTIRISTSLPGASPVEVETQISDPLEEAVNTVQGIQELRSISSAGRSFLVVTFDLNRDIESAAQDVRDRVSTVLPELPPEADPPIISKFDNDLSPILTLAISGDRTLRELTELAEKTVKVQLERAPGVGEVEIGGDLARTINVWVDADRLAAYQIPITDVRAAIARQNSSVPAGNVISSLRDQPLRTLGRLTNAQAFNDLVIATVNRSPVRIRDIGWAEDGTREQRSLARLNGVPTVTLEVRRQSGANTIEVIEAIKQKFPLIEEQLPPDVSIDLLRDQSDYIYEAQHEITVHLVFGSILASLVVLAFMRNWRATIIAAVSIPASVIATFGMMYALDFTLNSVTMLALVLMVGIVIDDAIVVLENIFRFVEEKSLTPFEAARDATAEIGLAVLATTLSLVVIFVPVSFMSSISGRFLFQFGLTSAVAVLVSLLVSFTLAPMMSARFLRKGDTHSSSRGGFYGKMERSYLWLLNLALRQRLAVLIIAILVVLASVPLYKALQMEYTPGNVDEGEFEINAVAPEGASLATMNDTIQVLEADLRELSAIKLLLARVGGGGPSGSPNNSRFYVKMAPHDERIFSLRRLWTEIKRGEPMAAFRNNISQRELMIEVRRRLKKYTDLRTSVSNLQSFSLGGRRWEIDYALMGPDLETLSFYAEELRRKAPEIGIIDADTTLKLNKPELRVVVDRERAANMGVDAQDIATALRVMVGGDEKVTRFRDPAANEDYYVQLRLAEKDRTDATTISRLYVPKKNGGLVRLDNVVSIVPGQTASRIDRLDRLRTVSLRASVAPGYGLADRLEALNQAVIDLNMPPGYTTTVSGAGRELEKTFNEFLWAFLLSIIFMYMILASQFESFIHPFTILLSLPLSVPFAFFSLWITGNSLNLYSALGMLVLFGVVKKNAILQIDHMIKLTAAGMQRTQAILQANRDRLRPILMTTLALVAGMLPLAVGSGPGSEERRAIAIIVIGGQSLSLLLTLVVTPVVYSLFEDLRIKAGKQDPAILPTASAAPLH
ncbi:MAG: efflux RND transporter permease subunit [Verrucomicrobiota bacterium]|nr:efflux RND transporter permease subunit [Verrucomicrobiota bacterium]